MRHPQNPHLITPCIYILSASLSRSLQRFGLLIFEKLFYRNLLNCNYANGHIYILQVAGNQVMFCFYIFNVIFYKKQE